MRISRRGLLAGAAAAAGAPVGNGAAGSAPAPGRRFTGPALREIAFPLGGIGTGTVSLGGGGNLRDWEIFNRPAKGNLLPFTFAALRLAGGGLAAPAIRVLEREVPPPHPESHGIRRERGAGLTRFPEAVFHGAYPVARIDFVSPPRWPVDVSLEAFNPMIPLDVERSSLPVAILTYELLSHAAAPLDATLAFSITNPVGWDGVARLEHRRAPYLGANINEFRRERGAAGMFLYSTKYDRAAFPYGSMALATSETDVTYRPRWEHGAWWDELQTWWREFAAAGRFQNGTAPPSEDGNTEYATLAAHFPLEPGRPRRVTFVLAWHFPNIRDYWTGKKPYFPKQHVDPKRLLRNHYGSVWPDAWKPAIETLANLESLRADTLRYRDALYSTTLPPEVVDAVSSQSSILRTNTLLMLEGGVPLGFEGCGDDEGCCPFNCTHVFNYEQTLAHLYPQVERRMREVDFLNNLREDGYMSFRTATPLQQGAYMRHPAADGQMGCILKLYREWTRGAGDEWLRKMWPAARKALEFAWREWDTERDGIAKGAQHNTYDVRFYGPNTFVGTLYLGALVAGARMARHLGDNAAAAEYERVFRRGSAGLDKMLWNGEYYAQKTDASRKEAATWQFGEGCLSDQLLGQWFAEVLELGKLLPHEHIRQALRSVYRYNFREDFHDFVSGGRIYALNDEAGLLNCSWPRGNRPAVPFGYADEIWTGVEYEIAAHLVYEGMVEEGLRLVKAVRDRHDGVRRNPWDEVECGHHYARALSSWSLLTAWSGFTCSVPEKRLGFRPRTSLNPFRCFFSSGTAWGTYSQTTRNRATEVALRVEGGRLELGTLAVPAGAATLRVESAAPAAVRVESGQALVTFRSPVSLDPGRELALTLRP